jgi:hypothetical protein
MGAVANLGAAGAMQGARVGRKHQKQAAADGVATVQLLQSIDYQLQQTNIHAVALVNAQLRTNQLLESLLANGAK